MNHEILGFSHLTKIEASYTVNSIPKLRKLVSLLRLNLTVCTAMILQKSLHILATLWTVLLCKAFCCTPELISTLNCRRIVTTHFLEEQIPEFLRFFVQWNLIFHVLSHETTVLLGGDFSSEKFDSIGDNRDILVIVI